MSRASPLVALSIVCAALAVLLASASTGVLAQPGGGGAQQMDLGALFGALGAMQGGGGGAGGGVGGKQGKSLANLENRIQRELFFGQNLHLYKLFASLIVLICFVHLAPCAVHCLLRRSQEAAHVRQRNTARAGAEAARVERLLKARVHED